MASPLLIPGNCKHTRFKSEANIVKIEDMPGKFMAQVRLRCGQCDMPFQFDGLPKGGGFQGAYATPDGTEARLLISIFRP